MTIAIFVFLLCVSMFVHELGHALYMQKYGVRIKTFSIGLNCPLKIQFKSERVLGGATVQITPLLVGAYVEPAEDGVETLQSLPYKERADVSGAGPLANIMFAVLLVLVYKALLKGWDFFEPSTMIGVGVLAALYYGRKILSRYIFLPLGIVLTASLVWGVIHDPLETVAGPIGIIKMATEHSSSVAEIVIFSVLISLAIGLMNLLPFYPLDGGRIAEALLQNRSERAQNAFRLVGVVLLLLLVGLAFAADITNLMK